jgi:hypothetical protein
MATVQRIPSGSKPPSSGRYVLVRLGDKDELTRDGQSLVYTVSHRMPHNLFEAHVQRVISDAELMADQEHIETVFVSVDPQSTG